jgi:hypothetical protein
VLANVARLEIIAPADGVADANLNRPAFKKLGSGLCAGRRDSTQCEGCDGGGKVSDLRDRPLFANTFSRERVMSARGPLCYSAALDRGTAKSSDGKNFCIFGSTLFFRISSSQIW